MPYPEQVSRISPTLEGFRATFRRPSLTLAEITWRWAFGATACALFTFGLVEYLKTLPVTNADLFLLRTRHPVLVGQAVAHIVRGSLPRVVLSGLFGALGLVSLWLIAASIGRLVTIRALREYFRRRVENQAAVGERKVEEMDERPADRAPRLRSLLGLNFLRAAVALAAIAGFQGAAILAGLASSDVHPRPGLAFLLFLPLAALVCLVWWMLNWLLSFAAIFAVRGESVLSALSAAVTLCRERAGAIFAVGTWTGLAHIVLFVAATSVVSTALAFSQIAPWRLVLAAVLFVTLVYFAIADWLYVARLAGYVCIADLPEMLMVPAPLPSTPPFAAPVLQTNIDREELILSDVQLTPSP